MIFVFGAIISIFPTFLPIFSWQQDNSNIGLFILLYFITAIIKNYQNRFEKKVWRFVWIVPMILLAISAVAINMFEGNVSFFKGREMEFYEYNSVFVILEASLVFIAFLGINITRKDIGRVLTWISSSSLTVYLIHMHPIIKEWYTRWEIFDYINMQRPSIYLIEVICTCCLVLVIGTLFGKLFCNISDSIANRVFRIAEKRENKWL